MSHGQHAEKPRVPPESFVKQVKDALEHLYDFPYLQQHPLVSPTETSTEVAGQRLRQELVAAIERLNPGDGVPFRALPARHYNAMMFRYMEGLTVQATARELGISYRQALRDLRQGEESVALVLWGTRAVSSEPKATHLSSFEEEMARLPSQSQPTDIGALLQRAQGAVQSQADRQDVIIRVELPREPVIVSTNPMVAEQVLVNTLSHTISLSQPGVLRVGLTGGKTQPRLTLHYRPKPETANVPLAKSMVGQLVEELRWGIGEEDEPEGTRLITVQIRKHDVTVLVIDDNEGLVNLLQRYLTDHVEQVLTARDGREGLTQAQEMLPDAIVLDVMMPGLPGWEVLQRLRNDPRTVNIPVIVCSIIDNPELAFSLGASFFLPKPVSRNDVLNALHQLAVA